MNWWEIVSVLVAPVVALLILTYTKRLANKDPRQSNLELNAYLEILESADPLSIEKVEAGHIYIQQVSFNIHRQQISGGMFGAIANSTSKYRAGYIEKTYESRLIISVGDSEIYSPPIKALRISIEFLLHELKHLNLIWVSTDEGFKGYIDIRPIIDRFGK